MSNKEDMTRQEKLKEIGNMHLSEYASKFIIPVPHKFYENDTSIFNSIKNLDWSIENEKDTTYMNVYNSKPYVYKNMIAEFYENDTSIFNSIKDLDWSIDNEKDTIRLNAYNIKSYIYRNMIPEFNKENKKSFIDMSKTLLLNKKPKDFKLILEDIDGIKFELILKEIDLWIFKENISFFVLSIDLNDSSKYTINQINYLNNILRSYKFLKIISKKDNCIHVKQTKMIYGEKDSFLKYLLKLTHVKELDKSFLNIEVHECTKKHCEKKDLNDLYSIYNSSSNAKLILGMQTKTTSYANEADIEKCDEKTITFIDATEMSILREIPYYLATCSSLSGSDKGSISDNGYIYQLIDKGGFNIWKYSSGLTLHDSSAFIGLGKDGGPIVNNVNGVFYFIYMLNLYIKFQATYIAHSLIDQHFESKKINYWYRQLQILKNQFVSDDIGVKFQENELNKSISQALGTQDILSEVSSNLVETKNITNRNLKFYIALIGFILVSIWSDEFKTVILSINIVYIAYTLSIVVSIFIIALSYRHKILKIFKF